MQPLQLRTEIKIDASASRIWQTLVALQDYPRWNPLINSIQGEPKEGEQLDIRMAAAGGRESRFKPTVVTVAPGRELRWRGHQISRHLMTIEHFFRVQELEGGSCRLFQGQDISGWLVNRMAPTLANITRAMSYSNESLRKHLEASRF